MIIYTCPECGTDLIEAIATSNPPQRQFVCPSCGWQHWHEDKEEIIRIPYGGNGGPGNCNCILGAPKITC